MVQVPTPKAEAAGWWPRGKTPGRRNVSHNSRGADSGFVRLWRRGRGNIRSGVDSDIKSRVNDRSGNGASNGVHRSAGAGEVGSAALRGQQRLSSEKVQRQLAAASN